ncbi:hypothetical protein KX02_1867 (plasmid) [Francisella tularensis subsp. novicida]|nr:hypothetical protein KX02_1867 [Francisella tularensis subsp. novicida]
MLQLNKTTANRILPINAPMTLVRPLAPQSQVP